MSMVEWGVIGLSAVGAYKGVKGKAPALRNTFSKAKISELFGLSRTKKTGATASASETNATKAPTRLDVIPETEMVQKAATMPGEWKGQFKVLKEGSEALTGTEFSLNVYSKQVLFKDPKTGQMFRVFQRNDIDPNYVVKSGPDAGRINSSLLKEGRAPYTSGDEQVIIHHMGQDAFGPFVEVTKTTHKSALHNQFGYGQKHPSNPVIRSKFNPVRKAYWRAYGEQFK